MVENLSLSPVFFTSGMPQTVGDEELARAKNQLKLQHFLQLDGTTNGRGACSAASPPPYTADDIGRQVLACNERRPLYQLFDDIDAVTKVSCGCHRGLYCALSPNSHVAAVRLCWGGSTG